MNTKNERSPIEIGSFISKIREQSGMKQAELAKKITWSPAMLSRIELGERSLSSDELQIIAEAISTPEALQLSEMLKRQWSILPSPPLNHPDQNIFWQAEQVAQELSMLSERPDIKQAFQRRLQDINRDITRDITMVERTIMNRIDNEVEGIHKHEQEVETTLHHDIDETRRYIDSRIDKVVSSGTLESSKRQING